MVQDGAHIIFSHFSQYLLRAPPGALRVRQLHNSLYDNGELTSIFKRSDIPHCLWEVVRSDQRTSAVSRKVV